MVHFDHRHLSHRGGLFSRLTPIIIDRPIAIANSPGAASGRSGPAFVNIGEG
jgi:hypothetical protein